jgi:lactosylceramide 4-alpha-galactosyltransferase
MTSPFVDQRIGRLSSLTRNLTNLQVKYLNVDSFVEGTPLERLWKNDVILSSRHLVSHLSDVLRFLILRRFGGTYLDSDVIVLKPLPDFPNFVGRESWTHPFVGECLGRGKKTQG